MGEIAGAGVLGHVPTIMLPEAERRALNGGRDISLVPGLARLRAEVLDALAADTMVIFDTHWFTTLEHVLDAADRRTGTFTSDELPRFCGLAYDYPGDPELAYAVEKHARDAGLWVYATDDANVARHYPTLNLVHHLRRDERVLSVGVCQTAEPDDFLAFGAALGAAVTASDRRVVLIASGGLSHRFWPLKTIRDHEASDPAHVITPEARAADERIIERWQEGRHAAVIDGMPEYARHAPEGYFGHYLMLVGALGGRDCTAPGRLFSEYENAVGTGQVHMWFDRPAAGWTNAAGESE